MASSMLELKNLPIKANRHRELVKLRADLPGIFSQYHEEGHERLKTAIKGEFYQGHLFHLIYSQVQQNPIP